MEKGSGGSAPPPPPLHMEDFQLEGKKPVKNPFVPIGMYAPPASLFLSLTPAALASPFSH
jgi:hypothetical protein